MSMLRQVLLRNALRRLTVVNKPSNPALPVKARTFYSDERDLRNERTRSCEGHSKSSVKDAPNWSERLASDSEAIVKSERSVPTSFDRMQKDTVEYLTEIAMFEPTIRIGFTSVAFVPAKDDKDGLPQFFGVEEIQIADSKYE